MSRYLLSIDSKLRIIFQKLEQHMGITLDAAVINAVFEDAENDQVASKDYLFFKQTNFFWQDWTIEGSVGEYEPDDIFIQSKGGLFKQKAFDLFLTSLTSY